MVTPPPADMVVIIIHECLQNQVETARLQGEEKAAVEAVEEVVLVTIQVAEWDQAIRKEDPVVSVGAGVVVRVLTTQDNIATIPNPRKQADLRPLVLFHRLQSLK